MSQDHPHRVVFSEGDWGWRMWGVGLLVSGVALAVFLVSWRPEWFDDELVWALWIAVALFVVAGVGLMGWHGRIVVDPGRGVISAKRGVFVTLQNKQLALAEVTHIWLVRDYGQSSGVRFLVFAQAGEDKILLAERVLYREALDDAERAAAAAGAPLQNDVLEHHRG